MAAWPCRTAGRGNNHDLAVGFPRGESASVWSMAFGGELAPVTSRSSDGQPSHAHQPNTIIAAGKRRAPLDFSELLEYREVVYFLVWRDFKVRYRQTYLGVLWAIIQPVVSTGVFTVVFGKV